ncbi:hypothetical protein QFC20_002610 [Naganishia adeliensis]|uniref:Uncharacterized protein n=1 Tax=Naganishia adeliensis TaxID=92952 RepID=A0ACC2WJC8_9TREE|nr:hypothetical protein QFC20_002610 [Naganishia adeliensis]
MGHWYPTYDDDGSFIRCYASSSDDGSDEERSGWCDYCKVVFESDIDAVLHKDRIHHYCVPCDRLFRNENGLQNHLNTAAVHTYQARSTTTYSREIIPLYTTFEIAPPPDFPCRSCNQAFNAFRQLEQHRLTYHREIKNHACPFCGSRHASLSAVTAHLESGACPSGANRHCVDERIIRATTGTSSGVANAIVPRGAVPPGPPTIYRATEMARNSYGRYGCYFCPGMDFATLYQLNQHLESPKHSNRTPGMYTCPKCQTKTQTLSGLIQHAEMGGCGVRRDARVQVALEGLTQGMKQLGWLT